MRRLLVVLVLLAAGCGSSDDDSATPNDTVPRFGCEFGPYVPLSVIDTAPPLLQDSEAPAIADAIAGFVELGEPAFPPDGWRLLTLENETTATLVNVGDTDLDLLSFMTVRWEDGWVWDGAANADAACELQREPDPDVGTVEWELDPDTPIGPESTTLTLLASEQGCASGQPMGDRFNEPSVALTTDAVTIHLSVQPLTGGVECPDNPTQLVEIDLGEPLGDRPVRDARSTDLGTLRDRLLAAIERDG